MPPQRTASLALGLLGCGDACPEVGRLDGGWAVYSQVDPNEVTGTNAGNYPWDDMFVAGWSEWDMMYVPARQEFALDLDSQPYTATYTPDAVDCETFVLAFDGTYVSEAGTTHTFTWSGTLTSAGTHFQGTFAFEDDWEDPVAGTSGTLSAPEGDVTANVRED